jgi:hypothetical protein
MSQKDSEAEAGWAKAEKIATGITDHGIAGALRTYYLVFVPIGALLLIGLGFIVSALALQIGFDDWIGPLGVGVSAASLGAFIGGFVYARKRVNPLVQPQRQSAAIWLEKPERKNVSDQIFGKVPPRSEHLPAVRGIAAQTRQALALQLLLAPGYILMCAAQLLLNVRQGFEGISWIWPVLTALFAGVFTFSIWQFKRSEHFLSITSAQDPPKSPS